MNALACNGKPHAETVPDTLVAPEGKGDRPIFAPTTLRAVPEIGTVPAPAEPARDPREALDAVKRATVVALVRLGGSRRMAAAEVGCAHRTIARTAARDPQFAAELAAAESKSDHKALALIDRATDQEKYWRAAAWMLERRNPEEFARRAPNTMTPHQVLKLFTRFLAVRAATKRCQLRHRRETLLAEYESVLADMTGEDDPEFDKKEFNLQEVEKAPVAAVHKPLLESACPREEAAARQWLAALGWEQLREMKYRADEKPKQPDWDRWRELVDEALQAALKRSNDEYDRERRARRAARRQAEAGRCAPPSTQEGCQATNGHASAKPYGNGTYDGA